MMTRTARSGAFVLAAFVASVLVLIPWKVDAFRHEQNPALRIQRGLGKRIEGINTDFLERIRGGSSAIDVEIESSDEEESDNEESGAPTLAKATKKAATKAVKKSVAAAMSTSRKKSKFSLGNFFKLPYIVKASLNPLVFFQMTVGYWKSLVDVDYLTEKAADSSQGLRSALEQKARLGGAGKKPRGNRRMKPGQAKTLSDLPQLNT